MENVSEKGGIPYLNMGAGFIIGLAVGYMLKKSFKILLLLLGLGLVIVFILESQGVIALNEDALGTTVSAGTDMFKSFYTFLKNRLDGFNVGSGFSAVAGFFIGLKIG